MTTDRLFELVRRIGRKTDVPLVLLSYANRYLPMGRSFFAACQDTGVDGVILPDVPFEEKEECNPTVPPVGGLHSLSRPPPRTHRTIAREAEGSFYCVSSLGVTGVREHITTDVGEMVSLVKKEKDIPCAVGFGISTPEQAREMARVSDGAYCGQRHC